MGALRKFVNGPTVWEKPKNDEHADDDQIELFNFECVDWKRVNVAETQGVLLTCNEAQSIAHMRMTARSVASAKVADALLSLAFLLAAAVSIISPMTALYMLTATLIVTAIISKLITNLMTERLEEARAEFSHQVDELADKYPSTESEERLRRT